MSIGKTWVIACTLITAAFVSTPLTAQDCTSCSGASTIGLAGTHVGNRGLLGHHGGWCPRCQAFREKTRAHLDHLGAIHDVGSARNKAWPKPFACADRQRLFAMWDQMLDQGWRAGCIFTNDHFVADSEQLNEAGQAKLAGIMKNNAIGQKAFYVQRTENGDLSRQRLATLRTTVEQWYGLDQVTEIAFTDHFPTPGAGLRVEIINQLNQEETPAPVIPVASGQGSTSDVQSGD